MKLHARLAKVASAIFIFIVTIVRTGSVYGQTADSLQVKLFKSLNTVSEKQLGSTRKYYQTLQTNIQVKTADALKGMQKNEEKLQRKLQGIDSAKSRVLFKDTKAKYEQMEKQLQLPGINSGITQKLKNYLPHLDSLQVSFAWLGAGKMNIPGDKLKQIQAIGSQIKLLEERLQSASQVQVYIQQREQFLKQQLAGFDFKKQLTSINKEAYYYQQRISDYKAALKDKDKLKQTILATAMAQPAFRNFWRKNSLLASMFPMDMGNGVATDSLLKGLQTRAQVGNLINEKTGKSLPGNTGKSTQAAGSNYLSQQVQQAKSELDQLKQKARKIAGGGSTVVIPDFTPNSQKTKTFLKRIEYGLNMQNTPSSNWLPATSNIAAMLGYKFSDKIVAGLGIGYLLGWGAPIKDIHFSNQGVNVRTYFDLKAKGSLWVTGGLEYNYLQAFSGISDIRNLNVWQKSALAGLTKKFKTGSKTTNLQLLYDFLAGQQIPKMAAIKFRVGYSF